ncbi:DUF3027 domain-containing protein [Leucobacter luti]|uniref:DUF3027 family protein n=1 Tax=Leucobacter luti TaxID=340320 RepID=A0A4Q7U063_9MICO|nr:DUF3027 domain-containing protein [Leucobacter luti]MBL3698878.1 DUF3027 domain-containing protein [Leucobacter luti]RZT66257.1 DUF3027 family protein [Leucobacter luti]
MSEPHEGALDEAQTTEAAPVEAAALAPETEAGPETETAPESEDASETAAVPEEPATPSEPDPALLAARSQARAALEEITGADTIGADGGFEVHDEHLVTLFFECRLPGYPGWHWAAALTRVDEASPVTVLEVELLPGEGAVVAPDWVPWSERLAQYREGQARQAAEESAAAEDAAAELDDDAADDLMDNDFSDFDDELDGVDIDALHGSDDDDDDDDRDDDEDLDDEADDTELFDDDSDDEEE